MHQESCGTRQTCKFLKKVLHLLLIITILNSEFAATSAAPSSENMVATGGATLAAAVTNEVKRNWQSLQGPWGKRAHIHTFGNGPMLGETNDLSEDEESRLIPLLVNNGEHDGQPILKYSKMMYLMNDDGTTLQRLLNDDKAEEQNGGLKWRLRNDGLITFVEEIDNYNDDESMNNMAMNEKRAWNKINTAWGKRRNAPTWNKFRGAWGKREPGWNNLRGMWGKRSSKDWGKLHGGWGKRESN